MSAKRQWCRDTLLLNDRNINVTGHSVDRMASNLGNIDVQRDCVATRGVHAAAAALGGALALPGPNVVDVPPHRWTTRRPRPHDRAFSP